MGDLLEYFEAQGRNLDEMSASLNSPLPTNFTSCIRFNGIPILPPVMTQKRREEMLTYRRQAMKLENRRKSKQREKLVARVQTIVAEVEEKQGNRLSDSFDDSSTDVSSKWSPESVNSSKSPGGKPQTIKTNKNKETSQNFDKKAMSVEKTKPIPSKEKSTASHNQTPVSKSEKMIKEQRTKIPAPVQNTKKSQQKGKPKPTSKAQGKALSNLKKSSSMSSLPNPAKIPGTPSFPLPKPPSTKMTELQARRSNMLLVGRISFSNPDLRDFDDDNSISCKSESGISRNTRKRKSKSAWQKSNQHSASDPDVSRNEVEESQGFVLSPEDPILRTPQIHRLKNQQRHAGSNPELSTSKYSPDIDTEKFKKEVIEAQRKEKPVPKPRKDAKKMSPSGKESLSKESSKSTPVQNEQKTDEPQSLNDLPSLDDCNSLPHEFSGLPLTSVKQQQIGQVLAKLSKCLNLQDTGGTLNSTSSSSSTENNAKQPTDKKKAPEDDKKPKFFPPPSLPEETGLNQSGINSSVISSVGSVGTTPAKRMSPKGLKNTVHFSSFITEISTSASQSVEDKISVRKMDITPSNSVELKGNTGSSYSSEIQNQDQYGKSVPKNTNSLGTGVPQANTSQPFTSLVPGQPGSMLSKVALSPEESPGSAPKTFFKDQEVPFHVYTAEIEHNTSDKENENIFQNRYPDVPDKLKLLENELNKNCDQTYGNIFMLTGKRSNESDDRSQGSTLKESQENVLQGQRSYFKNDIYSDANKTDLEKVMKVTSAVTGSSGHLIGDVSQSNHLSQGMTAVSVNSPITDGKENSPKIESRQFSRHVRHGSYTLEQPSEALLNTQLIGQQYSGPSNGATRMNIGPESLEPVSVSQNDINIPTPQSAEQSAKAEHIQRYLSQVQNHSAQNVLETSPQNNQNTRLGQYDIAAAVQSFTETLQSMESLSEEEMLKIQADHFHKIRQHLIEQQKQQLEELFVNQRREQMKLQNEIETHHKHLREQQEMFSSFSEPNNLSQFSIDNFQNTSVSSFNDLPDKYSQNIPVNTNRVPFNPGNSFVSVSSQHPFIPTTSSNRYVPNTSVPTGHVTTSGYVPTASGYIQQSAAVNGYTHATNRNGNLQNTSMISNIPENINQPVYSQQMPSGHPTQQKFSYISSPSLYFNPKDRDNESDISTFSKVTPKQSLKFNHSTPSPKSYKPVMHSPVKEIHPAWTSSIVAFPESAFDPRLQPCFDRLSACVKGYLTRRLLVTEKVQEVVKTINDTKCFARSFQAETPIKKGQVNNQDRDLLDRIIAQLQAALLDLHEIFFDIPVWERMQLISHDRQLREERRLRESGATTRSSVSSSQPRMSAATLKALERKRKAQEAEAAVFGDIRPRTAPPVNQRCQRESMDIRALQPVQTSHSHNTTQSGNTTARIKTRPKTAPSQPSHQEQQHQQPTQTVSHPSSQQTTSAKQRKTANTAKQSTATVAPKKKKVGKAWR